MEFFNILLEQKFPIGKAVPVADSRFNFDDALSMSENNSSGFNPRIIPRTGEPSNHASGRAIDVNPFQNPYIVGNLIEPRGARYDPKQPGTFTVENPAVEFLESRGWIWGGDYETIKDYHHFEKLVKAQKSFRKTKIPELQGH